MRRTNTSRRPVELLGLPIAEVRRLSASPSSSGMMYTQPRSRTAPPLMSIRCIASSASRSSTFAFFPGRKLARTRQATPPRRKSRLAGWIWSGWIGSSATISFDARTRYSISCDGRMPVECAASASFAGSAPGPSRSSAFIPRMLPRIEHQLRAAEERELAPLRAVRHHRVPHLGAAPQVHGARFAVERAFARRVEKVGLQLHRGEVLGLVGQVGNAAVAREGVGEGDDRARVQVAVRGEQRLSQGDLGPDQAFRDHGEGDADEPGQEILAENVHPLEVESGAQRHDDSLCGSKKHNIPAREGALATPHHLGKYEITDVLGQGAMGVVYKGFDPGIRRTVAIKTIRRELVEGERHAAAMLARFRNEAQAAGKLSHPAIVAVYDYGEDAEVAYIAMEFVEGNSLREYIGRGTRFAERDAVSVMSQLLEGLAHAHERRVWHRDIKPGNVIAMPKSAIFTLPLLITMTSGK